MVSINIHYPRCDSALVYSHGKKPSGQERFRYCECHCVFQLTYTYQARNPSVRDQIVNIAFNDAGVRDTARTLNVGARILKNSLQVFASYSCRCSTYLRA